MMGPWWAVVELWWAMMGLWWSCDEAMVGLWWAMVGPYCDTRDGSKGSFLLDMVSCLRGCAAQPK